MNEQAILSRLKREVCVAQGCTEPIAVSYAVSLACEDLKEEVQSLDVYLSTNMLKNAMGVGIPGTGETGLEIAVALGAVIQQSSKGLEILCDLDADTLQAAHEMIAQGKIHIHHAETNETLYIEVQARSLNHHSTVRIAREHTHLIYHACDGQVFYEEMLDKQKKVESIDQDVMTVQDILDFSRHVAIEKISFLEEGALMNKAVSDEGLKGSYGLQVGRKIKASESQNLLAQNLASHLVAVTAAASDARMDGCPMPIMTTAGSGNQGITCSLPVYELAKLLDKSREEMLRALAISQLMTIHIKHYMGRLSPLCGAGIAGTTGACCGITYLLGGTDKQIGYAINNMLSDVSGMLCDGAKSTCALKIATNVHAAVQCANLALSDISPNETQGIVFDDAEKTISHLGVLVKVGLANADDCILDIMLQKC